MTIENVSAQPGKGVTKSTVRGAESGELIQRARKQIEKLKSQKGKSAWQTYIDLTSDHTQNPLDPDLTP